MANAASGAMEICIHNRCTRQAGFLIPGKLFFLMLGVGLLWAGGQNIHTALTNRKPAVMSYKSYAQTKPDAKWLVLTNCQLNIFQTCWLARPGNDNPREYYIPVHDPESLKGKICVLLKTTDPDLLTSITQIRALKSEAAVEDWVRKNPTRAFPRRNVQGLVVFGIDLNSTDRAKLAKVQDNIAEDFIILDSDAQPSVTAGICCGVGGLACILGLLASIARKTSDDEGVS